MLVKKYQEALKPPKAGFTYLGRFLGESNDYNKELKGSRNHQNIGMVSGFLLKRYEKQYQCGQQYTG
jgi:hypothetical protein